VTELIYQEYEFACQHLSLLGWLKLIVGANFLWEKNTASLLITGTDLVWEKNIVVSCRQNGLLAPDCTGWSVQISREKYLFACMTRWIRLSWPSSLIQVHLPTHSQPNILITTTGYCIRWCNQPKHPAFFFYLKHPAFHDYYSLLALIQDIRCRSYEILREHLSISYRCQVRRMAGLK